MCPLLFNIYMGGMMKEVKVEMGRMGLSFLEHGGEWRLPGHLYADDLVLCGESEEDGRSMQIRRKEGGEWEEGWRCHQIPS